jgi:hypothetical protein
MPAHAVMRREGLDLSGRLLQDLTVRIGTESMCSASDRAAAGHPRAHLLIDYPPFFDRPDLARAR